MKISLALVLALATLPALAQAASLKEIFQQIADTTEPGNGNGHSVTALRGPLNVKQEVAKLKKEMNKDYHFKKEDCRYDVHADIEDAVREIRDQWTSPQTASRLKGLADKELIRQIVYSVWDSSTGDSEYCSVSTMKVFGVDGSVLVFDFNETD